ncbi:MAG: response regulator transcription factor [Acutalibacteraceae bacterium]
MRILIAEDERDLNRIIKEYLEDEGYSVDACFDGEQAQDCLLCANYDALVLDIQMPKKNGIELVRSLRTKGDLTPVLFLTARDTVEDKISGLDSGADYYLTKPFSFDELNAVIRAISRKYDTNKSTVYTIDNLTVDIAAKTVKRGDKYISLSAKEFALLEYMVRNQEIVLTRDMIENNCWNYDYEGGTNVVDVYISYLRKKIDSGFEKKLIHTVWGTGWILRSEE